MILSDKHLGGHGYYGYKYNPETDEYEVVNEEAIVIKIISLLLILGYQLSTVADIMNTLGVRIPSGSRKGELINTTWIRRKFGIYKRRVYYKGYEYDGYYEGEIEYKDCFEKYNGANGFPLLLGDKVYAYVADLLSDKAYRKKYDETKKIGLYDSNGKELIIEDIKEQLSLEK